MAFICAACTQNEIDEPNTNLEPITEVLNISFEDDDNTRIMLNEAGKSVWNKNDLVSVFYKSTDNTKWQFQGEDGDRSGTLRCIEGSASEEVMTESIVVYPYNEEYTFDVSNACIEAPIAATQHYYKGSYDPQCNVMVACSDNNNFVLKNVCGWVKLSLTGNGEVVKSITLKGNNGEQLAGRLAINAASATAAFVADDAVHSAVKLVCEQGVALSSTATDFYIALAPQTLSQGFSVSVACMNYKPMVVSTNAAVTIERNHIKPMMTMAFNSTAISDNTIVYNALEAVQPANSEAFDAAIIDNSFDKESAEGIITFENAITKIGDGAFTNCDNLLGILIPASISEIGDRAFADCDGLCNLYCLATTPPALGEDVFDLDNEKLKIYIPLDSSEAYAEAWAKYISLMVYYDFDIEEEDSDPIFDSTITPYDGERATDGGEEVIGNDAEVWWEAGNFSKRVIISYSAEGATVENSYSEVATYCEGGHVVIDVASTEGVEILATGSCADGSLKIYGKKAVKLLMGGLDLSSSCGIPVNSQSKEPIFIVLGNNTTNRLADAKKYSDDFYYPEGVVSDDEDRKGAIFAEGNVVISGGGVLVVESKKKHAIATDKSLTLRKGATVVVTDSAKNAIHSKKGIEIMGGLIHATVSSEAGKCIKTDGDVTILGGKLMLNTTGDAIYEEDENDTSSAACIKTDGNLLIEAGEIICKSSGMGGKGYNVDGTMTINGGRTVITTTGGKYVYNAALDLDSSPKGVKVEGDITINGGSFNISVTGKSEGSEGLESKSNLTINGGDFYIYAYDDALNGGNSITINGGHVYCYAINNDGIDSNGKMTINGGVVIASGSGAPEEGFDCDRSTDFLVTGGILIGTGGNAVEPNSSSTQNTLIYRGLNVQMDDNIAIVNESGEAVLLYTIPRSINGGMCFFFSSPDFAYGKYSIQKGVTFADTASYWYGWWDTDEWSAGQELASIEVSSLVTSYGTGGGGPGGGGGGGWPGGGGGGGWPGRP